jgi:hypothetical protein
LTSGGDDTADRANQGSGALIRRLSAGESRIALAESAAVGMVLHERVIVALRRLAQEDASAGHFGAARETVSAD